MSVLAAVLRAGGAVRQRERSGGRSVPALAAEAPRRQSGLCRAQASHEVSSKGGGSLPGGTASTVSLRKDPVTGGLRVASAGRQRVLRDSGRRRAFPRDGLERGGPSAEAEPLCEQARRREGLASCAAWARPCHHRSGTQSSTACSANANRFSVLSRLGMPWLPCPKLRLMLWPWRSKQLNPSFSIFYLARPARAIAATLSAVTSTVVKNVFV